MVSARVAIPASLDLLAGGLLKRIVSVKIRAQGEYNESIETCGWVVGLYLSTQPASLADSSFARPRDINSQEFLNTRGCRSCIFSGT